MSSFLASLLGRTLGGFGVALGAICLNVGAWRRPKGTKHQSSFMTAFWNAKKYGLSKFLAPGWAPFEMHFGSSFSGFFVFFFRFGFGIFFGWYWTRFRSYLAPFWVASSATFPDFARNARPHENLVNSSQIEGPAPRKTIKKHQKSIEKTR